MIRDVNSPQLNEPTFLLRVGYMILEEKTPRNSALSFRFGTGHNEMDTVGELRSGL